MRRERVNVGESGTLVRGGSEQEHGKERVDCTVKESRLHGEKGGQAKRVSLREVGGSMKG